LIAEGACIYWLQTGFWHSFEGFKTANIAILNAPLELYGRSAQEKSPQGG
jgi:hypothetical protein